MKKNNRVVGVIGVSAHKSNFNADFEGMPRSNNKGFDASHASLKFPIRKYMQRAGLPVYYKKVLNPKDMSYLKPAESYATMFGELKSDTKLEVTKNLLTCADVHNFGATFAEKSNNISLPGAVQITDGINIYEDASVDTNDCLNPFVNSTSDKAGNTTMGNGSVLDEGHFVFGFNVNPDNYNELIGVIDGFNGYEEEMYQAFKKGAMLGVTLYGSVAKAGCDNEFALFVNFKENSLANLSNLHNYIKFYKDEDKNVFDLTVLSQYISKFAEQIDSVEVFYNEITSDIVFPKIEGVEIITDSILGVA